MSPRRWMTIPAIAGLASATALTQTQAQAPKEMHSHVRATTASGESGATARLLDLARKATGDYENRSAAIAAGYRRIGRDFPSMGEHWLSPRLLVEGVFDVSRPSVLTYVTVDGRPVLLGVVYAIPIAPGDSPPTEFGADAAWHEHNGTIDEEGLLAQHRTTPLAATGTRVAVLHAWTRIDNPSGVFAAENWAIPFVRLRLAVPETFPESAARALSLLSGGKSFFLDLAGTEAGQDVARALDECAIAVELIASRARSGDRVLTSDEVAGLDRAWMHAMTVIAVRHAVAARRLEGLPTSGTR